MTAFTVIALVYQPQSILLQAIGFLLFGAIFVIVSVSTTQSSTPVYRNPTLPRGHCLRLSGSSGLAANRSMNAHTLLPLCVDTLRTVTGHVRRG